MNRSLLLLLTLSFSLALPACGPTDDDAGDDDDDGNWNVEIINETTETMEMLLQRPCPSTNDEDWNEIPMGPDGLAPGGTVRTFLPQPGCFALSAEGEYCFAEGSTGTMQLGDVGSWTITEDDLLCVG